MSVAISAESIVADWHRSVDSIRPRWRQRKQLRDSLTPDVLNALEAHPQREKLAKSLHDLHFHPYWSFEPRGDSIGSDEQTAYFESMAMNTVAIGGNASGKTFCGAQRVIRFTCEEQPPPKRDTAFWVISDTYEQSCGACWAEKLATMIPEKWVDWDRVTWLSSPRNWPKSVPLKEWPGHPGKNWVLEFKSFEQGRQAMQARAIGGAWFSEQFPWNIYTEVFRGLREFGYPGSIWMEFTPIDPARSIEIQRQYELWIEGDPSTKSWEFFRLNTKAAADAGHVDKAWFDSFSAGLTDDMRETRLAGAFANYEGQIYSEFNPRVHLIDNEEFIGMFGGKMPAQGSIIHKRSFDWGAGEENAFCGHWGMKDAAGTWFIYDEYYSNNQSYTIADHCDEVKSLHPWPNDPWHRQSYGDPSGVIWIREFARNGIPIQPARNSVHIGIDAVKRLLQPCKATGEPRLFIVRDKCPNLARQMQTYRWERSSGQGINPRDAKPNPLKKDDHAVDALRYLIFTDFCDTMGGMEAKDVRQLRSKTVPFKRARA